MESHSRLAEWSHGKKIRRRRWVQVPPQESAFLPLLRGFVRCVRAWAFPHPIVPHRGWVGVFTRVYVFDTCRLVVRSSVFLVLCRSSRLFVSLCTGSLRTLRKSRFGLRKIDFKIIILYTYHLHPPSLYQCMLTAHLTCCLHCPFQQSPVVTKSVVSRKC